MCVSPAGYLASSASERACKIKEPNKTHLFSFSLLPISLHDLVTLSLLVASVQWVIGPKVPPLLHQRIQTSVVAGSGS